MSIETTRAEILRLIGRLRETEGPEGTRSLFASLEPSGSSRPARSRSGGRSSPASRAHRDRLERQQSTLAAIRHKRDQLPTAAPRPPRGETGPASGELTGVLTRIEERIAAIETRLAETGVSRPSGDGSVLPRNCTLGGGLRDGLLSDLLQLVSSNEWTGVFVVGADEEIRVEFVEGEIWNASGPGVTGEDAVYNLMARSEGPYYFQETGMPPEQRTVEGNTQFLILEGLRRLDEVGAGEERS
jgi:Domain of unknown function (DUF4388)